MARRFRAGVAVLVFFTALAPALGQESAVARLRADVTFLASDACEGRGPGTHGIDLAADYVAAEFKKAGLKPALPDGSYFQPFALPGSVLEAPATLTLRGPQGQVLQLKQGAHFWPMGLGHAGT